MEQGSGDQLIRDIFKAIDQAARGLNSEITLATGPDENDLKFVKIIICSADSVVVKEPNTAMKDLSDEN